MARTHTAKTEGAVSMRHEVATRRNRKHRHTLTQITRDKDRGKGRGARLTERPRLQWKQAGECIRRQLTSGTPASLLHHLLLHKPLNKSVGSLKPGERDLAHGPRCLVCLALGLEYPAGTSARNVRPSQSMRGTSNQACTCKHELAVLASVAHLRSRWRVGLHW